MAKRLIASLAVAGSLLMTVPAPVAAGSVATEVPAVGSRQAKACPPRFVTVPFPPGVEPDRNQNGLVCLMATPQGRIILIDDHRPL